MRSWSLVHSQAVETLLCLTGFLPCILGNGATHIDGVSSHLTLDDPSQMYPEACFHGDYRSCQVDRVKHHTNYKIKTKEGILKRIAAGGGGQIR